MKKVITFITVACLLSGASLKAQMKHRPMSSGGTPLFDSIYYWNLDTTTKSWIYNSKEVTIVYNSNDKMTSQLIQNWSGSAWIDYTADTFQYNSNNVDTTDIDKAWTGSKWENNYKYTYTYNAADSVTSQLIKILNGSGWRNYQLFTYTYDANNNKTGLLEQQWNGSTWTFGYKYVFKYNINNLRMAEIDSTGASYNRWLYQYNSHNLLVTDTSQYWNGFGWATDFNYAYYYNANNMDTSEVMQQWTGSSWVNYEKFVYSYDAGNNRIGAIYQNWSSSAWVNFQIYAYTYDVNNIMLSEVMRQYFNNGNTVIIGDSTYWYFNKFAGINQLANNNGLLSVYPNPGNGIFKVEPAHPGLVSGDQPVLEIYNIMGQKINFVMMQQVQNYYEIDLSNQPNGVYLLRIKSDHGVMNGKIVIQK
ncbi:MAG TPA: T9SS type A sorting domain-containing protein [Ferruginibacter sp.]|jgi:hypothetical protein|nr:T9SS type A sorting domain-containing protein [Ferruginibacter sp.]